MEKSALNPMMHQCFACVIYNNNNNCFNFTNIFIANTTQYGNCADGDIRLIGGDTMNDGNVQLCYNNAWGSICDANWDNNDSNVACYKLGLQPFGKGISYYL